jgi:hypothetical protein
MGAVIGPPDQPVAIAWARVAIAVGDGRTMRWAQVSVTSGPSGFAWLIPVEPGARIDLTTDAWLDALDAATVPVVLPPAFASSCEVALTPEITPSRATPSTLNPTLAHVAFDLPTLTAFVSASGFEIGSDLQKGLESTFAAGEAILMLTYAGGGSVPVRTLRVADTGPATLPFALTGSSSLGPIEVSAFTLAGSEEEAGLPPLVLPGGSILWLASGQSNYDDEVASLLASSGGTSWFNQSASPAVLFRPNAITPSLAVPSVL